ncbi:hypothetical protein [Paenibacillus sp. GM2]|uniref:hypothetical protein n=1 Tax=Paenibacillus sp. GM2 TaxID=1622070 RepID=UPI000839CD76|nr:hypothetical protein [Paenibacillus sp. GM2]
MSPKTTVLLIGGLQLKNSKAILRLSFDDEYFIITERNWYGLRYKIDNVFKIPLGNIAIMETHTKVEHQYIDTEVSKTVVRKGVLKPYARTKTENVKKKESWLAKYFTISYFNSDKHFSYIKFVVPDAWYGRTKRFNKKLKKKHNLVAKSPEVMNFYMLKLEEKQRGNEKIL